MFVRDRRRLVALDFRLARMMHSMLTHLKSRCLLISSRDTTSSHPPGLSGNWDLEQDVGVADVGVAEEGTVAMSLRMFETRQANLSRDLTRNVGSER